MLVPGTTEAAMLTRGGKQSKHLRIEGSTFICRLLNSTSMRPHREHGSGELCGFGRFVAGIETGWNVPSFAFNLFCAGSSSRINEGNACTRGGKHSRHLRLQASIWICLLLKRTPNRPQLEHGSSEACGFGKFVGAKAAIGIANEVTCAIGALSVMGVIGVIGVMRCPKCTLWAAHIGDPGPTACAGMRGPATRGGRQSRHLRRDGSICIWRLLKNTPTRLHPEHGSGALQGLGKFESGDKGAC